MLSEAQKYINAEKYINSGWAIFPLQNKSKVPATANGFKDARKDLTDIKPTHNIGIATGKVSGIVVLDFDIKSGGLETLEKITNNLPPTLVAKTGGGGYHYYYKFPTNIETIKNRTGLLQGMDVRADGGYVVAPPSVTESTYEWLNDKPLAELNEYLLGILVEKPKPKLTQVPTIIKLDNRKGRLSKATVDFMTNGAPDGKWNSTLFKAAKDYQEQKYNIEEFLDEAEKITGYLDHKDISTISSAFNSEPKYSSRIDNNNTLREILEQCHLISNLHNTNEEHFVDLSNGKIYEYDPKIIYKLLGKEGARAYRNQKNINAIFQYNPRIDSLISSESETNVNVYNFYIPPKWKRNHFYQAEPIETLDRLPAIYDRFFTHLVGGHQESKEYLLDWMANSIKGRNFTILTAIGTEGVGKGILSLILRALHGEENFAECTDTVLKEKFNGKLQNKTLVYIDEVALEDKAAHDRIKAVVNETLEIEKKGIDAITSRNWANFYISSNHLDAIRVSHEDRRYSILQLTDTKLKDTDMRQIINTEILNENNLTDLAKYLYARPITHDMLTPFRSRRFDEMLAAGLTDWEIWVIEDYLPTYTSGQEFTLRFLQEEIQKNNDALRAPPSRRKIEALQKKYPAVFTVTQDRKKGNKRMIRVF